MPMRIPAALCACLAVLFLAQPALAADPQKKPDDFRDLKWGASPSSQPGLTQVERDGDIVHYERPSEKKDLGGVALKHVTYSFYKNQFYHAEIDYEGKDAAESLQRSLEAKYGPPDAVREKADPSGKPYVVATWNWPGHAFIGNRHDKDGTRGRVFYFYAPLTDASAKAQGLAPPPAPAKAASGEGAAYKVKKGDSLERIAKSLGISEQALVQANPGLTDKNLKAGANLAVPGAAAPNPDATWGKAATPPAGPYVTYTVKDGDILSKVANSHGARTRDVIAANPGINPDALRPGTELKIPVKAGDTPTEVVAPPAGQSPAAP
ncbi:MAG: LysM peptidoglycan-binding domain-containing protein [Solidesulfovibrio sp. DCME]|uniref:LysM peptidoglycan-binding domain-containing protein n=1 Tax=Solidesulfovibrio sp. DCME TaxID=3447380 RepID=UPI003D0AC89C